VTSPAFRLLAQEARALLTRLQRVRSFVLSETMVPAAALTTAAQAVIERLLLAGRRELRPMVETFIQWVTTAATTSSSAEEAHKRFAFLRLRFNAVLAQFDMFSEVLTQRSEHTTGVLLAGLDAVAADALRLDRATLYDAPPLICYLQRGPGAAIRRARTRLPGGAENPVGIISVPRERMVGSGIASSLVHEVGHQGAALLELATSVRPILQAHAKRDAANRAAWLSWDRWIGEILADLWSASRVGVAAPLGLMGVLALPRVFVFRRTLDEAHPIPWIRVKLSCAFGKALYPSNVWDGIAQIWQSSYPPRGLEPTYRLTLQLLERNIPTLVPILLGHRAPSLRGSTLGQTLYSPVLAENQFVALVRRCVDDQELLRHLRPTLAFSVLARARLDGKISPERESQLLTSLLTMWAMNDALGSVSQRALAPARARLALAS
jgi:hypothetical protein